VSIQALLATSAVGAVGGGGAIVSLSAVAALTVAGSSGTFASCTATTTGGVASAWVWSVISQVGGTFSIASGAGTATAAAQVTGVVGASATALLQCVVTVGGTPRTVTTALSFTNSTIISVSIESVPARTGVTGSTVFNACSITATGGTPSSYVWSFVSPVNGTFTDNGGAGTSVFGSQVSGVAAGTTATATLQCVVTIGGTPYTVSTPLSYSNTSGSSSFTVNVSPTSLNAASATQTATTALSFTANLTGGTGPYSYVWLCTYNDAELPNTNFSALSPTSAVTRVQGSGLDDSYGYVVASFTCTVTDSASHSAVGTCAGVFRSTFGG